MEKTAATEDDNVVFADDSYDVEQNEPRPRLTFVPTERPERTEALQRRQTRAMSMSSISSIRSRVQPASAAAGIPIEFRTLSFQVASSQDVNNSRPIKKPRKISKNKNIFKHVRLGFGVKKDQGKKKDDLKRAQDADHFDKMDAHILDIPNVLKEFNTSDQGLTPEEAAARLARDGKNALPHRRENYFKKLFG